MSLPIEDSLDALRAALAANAAVVLQAPPGAGKTTAVPPALLGEPWLAGKAIVMLEPRRLAARAAAARMAETRGEAIGETVGYRIRFESRVSKRTRIEVVTEGILTRRLQSDPDLEGVGLVIFDEFHERHLQTDLALALTRDSQRVLRPDLKILVMSATLDGAAVSSLLKAPLVTSSGKSYPVEIHYAPRESDARLAEQVSAAVRHAFDAHEGDVLAFLPGAFEIRKVQESLEPAVRGRAEILPLYGDLPWEQQQRALRPGGGRKIVLATPIAETSLTIEGVRIVVDGGYARVPQFDPKSGLTGLTTVRVSRASADQRTGRAGRVAPGVCYRLWTETTQRGLVPQPGPEIRSADLAPLALDLAVWGTDAERLDWIDPPPAAALAQARDLLMDLGALDTQGKITEMGRAIAALPLHPRLAHMIRVAEALDLGGIACDLAALLSERDILLSEGRRSLDLTERLEALHAFRKDGRRGAQAYRADPGACARVEQAASQWHRLIKANDVTATEVSPAEIGALLALAYPDRIGMQREPNGARYLLAGGRGARVPEWEKRLRPPMLVAARLDLGEGEATIQWAAPTDVETLRRYLGDQFTTEDVVRWDDTTSTVIARREERLGKLVLNTPSLSQPDSARQIAAMLAGIRRMGLDVLPWSDGARELQARVACVKVWFPEEEWPDLSDNALLATLDTWLAPYLDKVSRRDHLANVDLLAALRGILSWQQQKALDEKAPTHLTVPSGSSVRLQYIPGQSPVLAVKLQELFGLADTPRIAAGRIPVMLHLLSPARRPIQVTQDLKGFWDRTYAEVRKELKGRYPKHPWPEDPHAAMPTARAKRRSS
ncbi:MAG: ATP-dependent helicase HrpB [Gammaproteobacteria bacterium]